MDALTFLARLVEALAWPTASVALVFMLRGEIKRLLPHVKKLKAGPLEAEFEREVKELKASAEAQPTPLSAPEIPSSDKQVLLQLVQINPRSAVLEAWRGVEAASLKAVNRQLPTPVPSEREVLQPLTVVRLLHKANLLSPDDVSLYHDLRVLRNQAAHDSDFSPTVESALNYIDLAARLKATLEVVAAQ